MINSIGLNQSPSGSNALPNGYRVSSAYPNPFNPMTSFNIDLDQESFVSIKAYNILGQLIADVFSGNIQADMEIKFLGMLLMYQVVFILCKYKLMII